MRMISSFLSRPSGWLRDPRIQLGLILLLALILRLVYVLPQGIDPGLAGGDYQWYATEGRTLIRTGWTPGPLPTGPIFLLAAGYAEEIAAPVGHQPGWLLQRMIAGQQLFPQPVGSGQPIIRLLHAVLGTLTVLMLYRVGRAAWNHRAGLLAALGLAVNPIFILETGNTATETIAFFLFAWALALWMERIDAPSWQLMAAVGSLLALTALTRSVFLAFPAVFLLHLLLKHGWKRAFQLGLVLMLAMLLTISPWTFYNLVKWNRLTLTGEGLLGMLYVGAVGWQGPQAVDAALEATLEGNGTLENRQDAFMRGIERTIFGDPVGYAWQRVTELGGALLQPHNTVVFPGESIKALAAGWLSQDRTFSGLLGLTQAEQFWPKLLLYLFHYAALIGGIVGILRWARRWRQLFPLYAVFAYFIGIHLVLSAIPRYLFPLEMFWWLFAAAFAASVLWPAQHQTNSLFRT